MLVIPHGMLDIYISAKPSKVWLQWDKVNVKSYHSYIPSPYLHDDTLVWMLLPHHDKIWANHGGDYCGDI